MGQGYVGQFSLIVPVKQWHLALVKQKNHEKILLVKVTIFVNNSTCKNHEYLKMQ